MSGWTMVRTAGERISGATPPALRLTAGLLWLSNVSWKVPPDFGETGDSCRQLCGFVEHGIEDPVAPGYPWFLENVVHPNLSVFGWFVLFMELLLAALLLSGTFTRVAALLGLVQSAAIGLTVANASGEWYWSYILMAVLHLAVFATAAGRTYGVDAILRRARPRPGRPEWLEAAT